MKVYSIKTLYPEPAKQELEKICKNCKESVSDEVLF